VFLIALAFHVGASTVFAAAPAFQGTFTSASLCSPRGIGLSPSGDVFVGSDCQIPNMQRFTGAGGFVGTWEFPAGYFVPSPPNGVAVDGSGDVFVTDTFGRRMWKFTSSGALLASWGTATRPVDVAVNGSGEVFVAEDDGKEVEKLTNGGALLATIGSAGSGPGQFQVPEGITVDASGRIYVADYSRVRILRFLADGSFDTEFTVVGAPIDVAVGPDGNVYVLIGFEGGYVYQYSSDGALLQRFSSAYGLYGEFRIVISATGAIYITEQYNTRISKFQIDQTTAASRTTFGRLKAMYR
jgi:sugar lactone lactonase YvrE